MKVRADEHVSPKIVGMVCQLALSPEFDFTSVYESGQRGTEDAHWVTEFADMGGNAIVSADKDFFSKPHQVVAIDKTGLRVIYLHPRWANAPGYLQAAHILMWWRRIEAKLKEAKPREFWVVKWNVSEEGTLERKRVDYARFHRKLKREEKRLSKKDPKEDS